ncbi:unnamed protein product [Allacma fusca]|uniref:Uncharacterized protein n=1 Tax=Allacma fusca TaxID=39272 RepID=A0A8J2PDG4_9HEXA|nr:unnamed protein product [Allacma fusca]
MTLDVQFGFHGGNCPGFCFSGSDPSSHIMSLTVWKEGFGRSIPRAFYSDSFQKLVKCADSSKIFSAYDTVFM